MVTNQIILALLLHLLNHPLSYQIGWNNVI